MSRAGPGDPLRGTRPAASRRLGWSLAPADINIRLLLVNAIADRRRNELRALTALCTVPRTAQFSVGC